VTYFTLAWWSFWLVQAALVVANVVAFFVAGGP
jgi:hypothetical protein